MKKTSDALEEFGVSHEVDVLSAHRIPQEMLAYGESAAHHKLKVIITNTDKTAHLPDILASITTLPIISVPMPLERLDELDSLLSIIQIPTGVPVTTISIGGARNAGLLTVRILTTSDPSLLKRMKKFQHELGDKARAKSDTLHRHRSNSINFGD